MTHSPFDTESIVGYHAERLIAEWGRLGGSILITRADIERDYVTTADIMREFACGHDTAARWIKKYFDKSAVEIMGGRYYVHKSEVERWRKRYGDNKPIKGRRLRGLAD